MWERKQMQHLPVAQDAEEMRHLHRKSCLDLSGSGCLKEKKDRYRNHCTVAERKRMARLGADVAGMQNPAIH
jgi:hypothetical protein